MTRLLRLLPLAVLATALCWAADLTGTWDVKVELSAGSGSPTFKLKQEGDRVTGTYEGQLGNSKIEGTVKGDRVELTFTASDLKVVYTGKIESEKKMSGEADYGGQASGTWTATKR